MKHIKTFKLYDKEWYVYKWKFYEILLKIERYINDKITDIKMKLDDI